MATDRLKKLELIESFSYSGISSDTVLTNGDGESYIDLGNIDWDQIVIENHVTALTGTATVAVKAVALTTSKNNPGAALVTDVAAVKADGSTALQTATLATVGKVAVGTGRAAADGSAASNIGKYIGIYLDCVQTTSATGKVYLYVKGK